MNLILDQGVNHENSRSGKQGMTKRTIPIESGLQSIKLFKKFPSSTGEYHFTPPPAFETNPGRSCNIDNQMSSIFCDHVSDFLFLWARHHVFISSFLPKSLVQTPQRNTNKVKLATIVEGDPKAIATTPRCRGGRYSIPWIAPLYPWTVPYNAEC